VSPPLRMRSSEPMSAFIEPCLPSPADKPPSGSNWIHEIKHDGYRLMARSDPADIRLLNPQRRGGVLRRPGLGDLRHPAPAPEQGQRLTFDLLELDGADLQSGEEIVVAFKSGGLN
jgi:hypothetical protein